MRASLLNFGGGGNDQPIRDSSEMDEGIGGLNAPGWPRQGWTRQGWSFDSIDTPKAPSNTSQDARNSSNSDANSTGARIGDGDDPMGLEELPAPKGEFAHYELPPPPDAINQANMDDIRNQAWDSKALHTIPPDVGQEQDSEKAVDIHISEDDNAKVE